MRLLGLKTFRHGIHPPENKDETAGMPIRQFSNPHFSRAFE